MSWLDIRQRIISRQDNVIAVNFADGTNGPPPTPTFPGAASLRLKEQGRETVELRAARGRQLIGARIFATAVNSV